MPRPGAPAADRLHHAPAALAAATGLAWFLLHGGLPLLDPARIGWLYQGDWVAAQLGWSFFRSAPWQLPLGASPLYPFGVGSTVGYADGIPLVAVLLKPLAPILPTDFQYLGPWLALCFAAQGFAGAKLVALVTPSRAARAVGGALFALSPPLLHRMADARTGHASLCAHPILLAALWLALAPVAPGRARRRATAAALLVLLASGVHPYFVAMAAALGLAAVVRLAAVDRALGAGAAAVAAVALLAAGAAGLALFGYVGAGVDTAGEGFGWFSADLLALANPLGWSRFVPAAPAGEGQYEGFGYLGLGALALAAAAGVGLATAASRAAPRAALAAALGGPLRAAAPAGVAVLGLAVLALSSRVTAAGEPVLEVRLYDAVPGLAATFRSSGRFVWPLHAAVLLAAIGALALALRGRPALLAGALAAALLVQAADVRPPNPLLQGDGRFAVRVSDPWRVARAAGYRHLSLEPPFLLAGGRPVAPEPDACGEPPWPFEAWILSADLAYRLGLTIDAAYVARLDERRAREACAARLAAFSARRLDPATVWLVHPAAAARLLAAGATCGGLDGALVCVGRDARDPFAALLAASPVKGVRSPSASRGPTSR